MLLHKNLLLVIITLEFNNFNQIIVDINKKISKNYYRCSNVRQIYSSIHKSLGECYYLFSRYYFLFVISIKYLVYTREYIMKFT